MKQQILNLICRWFGHKDFEDVYCRRSVPLFAWFYERGWQQRITKVRYDVIQDVVCTRCGRVHRTILKSRISRAQLLHDGWFIEQD